MCKKNFALLESDPQKYAQEPRYHGNPKAVVL